jgi:UPF0755 protein
MDQVLRAVYRVVKILLGVVILIALVSLGAVIYLNAPPVSPVSAEAVDAGGILRIEPDGTALFEVRGGESSFSVGGRLFRGGIIRSRVFWDLLSRFDRNYIKSGTYRLSLPMTQLEIRSLLVSGHQILTRVTIPEGVTLKKTAAILEDMGICPAEEFLAAAADPEILNTYRVPAAVMEGYLYPDTYRFSPGYPPALVVRAMADTFFRRLEEIQPDALKLSPQELHQRVILASIVEREYRMDDEAPYMAGVFYNRLAIGMALQSCATVEYVITEIQGRPHPEILYFRDTEIPDPYNTYTHPGLPPGPISAPGAVALRAVFNPVSSEYLYFRLVDPSQGRHYFSKTLDDHIKAGVLYVKGRSS